MKKWGILAVIILVLFSYNALAEGNCSGNFGIGPYFGYYFYFIPIQFNSTEGSSCFVNCTNPVINFCPDYCCGNTFFNGSYAACSCSYTSTNCDDNNACTADSCDPVVGCKHTQIANCCVRDSDCNSMNGVCGQGHCNLATNRCQATYNSSSTVCRQSLGVCDKTEYCTGSSKTCPGNSYNSSSTVCRASGGVCDAEERCTGRSALCPADIYRPSTYVCRNANGSCDNAEKCTGTAINCPADTFKPVGSLCSDGAFCNGNETCDGNGHCTAGTAIDCTSYNISGFENCNNDPDSNPLTLDFRAPFTSACDESVDRCTTGNSSITHTCNIAGCQAECEDNTDCGPTDCDVHDGCVGRDYHDYTDVSNYCFANCSCTHNTCNDKRVFYNDSRCGECSNDDDCNSFDRECADGICNPQTLRCEQHFKPSTFVCHASAGACDAVETCTGSNANCPADGFLPLNTVCRAAIEGNNCDLTEKCNGTSPICPVDKVKTAGTVCRSVPSGASCDIAEVCDGVNKTCPANVFKPSTTVCRTAAGVCDVLENCTGNSGTCPTNLFAPFGTSCGGCSTCDGSGICTQRSCPPVKVYADKIVCDNEADLPNWGNGGPDVTATTAQDFINTHPDCRYESGWYFQWTYNDQNPGDNIGEAAGWTTFGPSDQNGRAGVNISNTYNYTYLYLREVFKQGFVPFSGNYTGPEFYCDTDVMYYNNWDSVANPTYGQTYYCIGFNIPKCGDGILYPGYEECDNSDCDDGNAATIDVCLGNCTCEHRIEACLHDVRVRHSYVNSVGTGIAIQPKGGAWIVENPAILLLGQNYTLKYIIDNKINSTNTIRVIVKIDSTVIANYTSPINPLGEPSKSIDFSITTSGIHNISLFVEKVNEIDCNMSDNYAYRMVTVGDCIIDDDCLDTNACTDDSCDDNVCVHAAVTCDDSVDCTVDTCDAQSGCIYTPNNTRCSDNAWCNGIETCTLTGCTAGSAPDCSDSISCSVDSCNEVTDSCVHTGNDDACNDQNKCTVDTCDPFSLTGCVFTTISGKCSKDSECQQGYECNRENCSCEQTCVPETEVCDGQDNDCDGCIDENVAPQACGSGFCDGYKYCVNGSFSDCSSEDRDCGLCAKCSANGACDVYDDTQDDECGFTDCPDGCGVVSIAFKFDYANAISKECQAISQCTSTAQCNYHSFCAEYCGASCYNNGDCESDEVCDAATCTCKERPPECGDGILQGNETCDAGSNNGKPCNPPYGGSCTYCTSLCANATLRGPYCGDQIVNTTYFEQCEADIDCPSGQRCRNCLCEDICTPSPEICNNIDDDCDGIVDEELTRNATNQNGLCRGNNETCVFGVWRLNTKGYVASAESCDGEDDDCDGQVDDGVSISCGEGCCRGVRVCIAPFTFGNCSTEGGSCGLCMACDGSGGCTRIPDCCVEDGVWDDEPLHKYWCQPDGTYHECEDHSYYPVAKCKVVCGASQNCNNVAPNTGRCDANCKYH